MVRFSSPVPAIAEPNYREIIPQRKNDVCFFLLEGFGHNSVTDLPFIAPNQFSYKVEPREGLRVIRQVLKLFFNHSVRGASDALDSLGSASLVRIERFPKP